jgi:ribose transport system permease protein
VRRTRLLAFLLAGLISAVAGIITASYLETADPSGPLNLMLPSIAAVFLGTAMLRDGRANLPGTVLGFLLWTVLASGLNQLGHQHLPADRRAGRDPRAGRAAARAVPAAPPVTRS